MNRATEREVKTFRIGQLIQNNPTYSYNALNKALIEEFGSGLRKQYVLSLVRGIREVLPTKIEVRGLHATGEQQKIYYKWRKAGFLPDEAKELTVGHGDIKVNSIKVYNSRPAQRARASRMAWMRDLYKAGWTKAEIIREAKRYYLRDKKASPWDFIRAEYRTPPKATTKAYRIAAKTRAQKKIDSFHRTRRKRR